MNSLVTLVGFVLFMAAIWAMGAAFQKKLNWPWKK